MTEENIATKKGGSFFVVLAIFGLLLGLFLTEIALRSIYYLGAKESFGLTPLKTTLRWEEDGIVGRRLAPNQTGWFVSPTKEYYTKISTNSKGWRDNEHNTQKSNNTYRILILGDSFVENFQVSFDNTFFENLEKNLNTQKIIDKEVEVVAMGLGDSGTAQQYLVFQNYGVRYNPDLVVHLFYTGNDIKNNLPELQQDPHRPYFRLENDKLSLIPFEKRGSSLPGKTKVFLKENLIFVELLADTKGKLKARFSKTDDYPADYHVYDKQYLETYQKGWNVTKKLILETNKTSSSVGADYILVSLANNEQVNMDIWEDLKEKYSGFSKETVDPNKPDRILESFCNKEELNCYYMLPFFKEFVDKNPNTLTHYPLDGHWNETGTKLSSEFLTKVIGDYLSIK